MFLNCWWKLEFPDRTHADTGRTCRLHTERKRLDSNPGTYSCGTFSVKLAGWRPFHDWPQRVFIVLSCTLNGGEVWCCGACMKTATSGCFCLYMSEYITEINIKLHDFHLCVFLSRAFLFNKVIKWKFSFLSAGVEGTLELDWVVLIPGI